VPHFYSFGYQVIRDPEHADSSVSGNVPSTSHSPQPEQSSDEPIIGNGLVWRCWHDVQPAEESATVKFSSSVICHQHLMIYWNGGGSRLQHSRNWLQWQDQFWLCQQQVLRQNSFFSVAGLVINAERSSLAPPRAKKLYLFMKTIVLLQHLMTTKLGYSCILYPCLCWCVELELVGCRLNLWWCQTCCHMDYEITILQVT